MEENIEKCNCDNDEEFSVSNVDNFVNGYLQGAYYAGFVAAIAEVCENEEVLRDIVIKYMENDVEKFVISQNLELQKYLSAKEYLNKRNEDDL
jgi:hypothetical protein